MMPGKFCPRYTVRGELRLSQTLIGGEKMQIEDLFIKWFNENHLDEFEQHMVLYDIELLLC